MSRPKDNLSRLYEILDEADEDILQDIFYYIIGRIRTIRAKKLADLRKELEIVRQKEMEDQERYSKLIDSFCTPKDAMQAADEEEVFTFHSVGPRCKGCGCVLYSHEFYDLCYDCDQDRLDEDDCRRCAKCEGRFAPDVDRDLCKLCEKDRAVVAKRLDDELDEYVSKRLE